MSITLDRLHVFICILVHFAFRMHTNTCIKSIHLVVQFVPKYTSLFMLKRITYI